MVEWNFRDLPQHYKGREGTFLKLLEYASFANATPLQSGYNVRGAARTTNGLILIGSNHEFGANSAIHCEESLAVMLVDIKKGEVLDAISILAGDPGNIATPCGNCRDVLKQYGDKDSVIISASPNGGLATVTPLQSYFKDDFSQVSDLRQFSLLNKSVLMARKGEIWSDTLGTKDEFAYGAAIESHDGELFFGGLEGSIEYHPVPPIKCAMIVMKYSSENPNRFNIKGITLTKKGGMPKVTYRDRQYLRGLADRVNAFYHRREPIPVTLLQLSEAGEAEKGWATNSDEWLPHPFTAINLGLENGLEESIRKLLS